MKTLSSRWMTALAVSVTLLTAKAAVPPAEQLLPNDTLAVLWSPDWGKVRTAGQQSPISLLWQDPAIRPFRDKFITKLTNDFLAPLEKELGLKLADYADLVQGQFTLAITRNGWNGTAEPLPAFVLVLDSRDKAEQLKKNLADVKQKLTDAGRKVRTDKIRDVEFTTVVIDLGELGEGIEALDAKASGAGNQGAAKKGPAPAAASAGAPAESGSSVELSLGQVQSVLLAGTSTKELEKVLTRLAGGGGGSLAETPAFEADARGVLRDGLYSGWIHFAPLAEILAKGLTPPPGKAKAEEGMALPMDKLLSALGLASLKTLAFNVRQTPDGEFGDLFLGVPEDARKGLFALLSTAAKDASPPAFVPTDAIQFSRWRTDGQKAWASVEAIANELAPGMLGFLLGQVEAAMKEKDPGFDFKKNIIGNLGDDLVTYQKAPKGATLAAMSAAPSVTLLASPNPEQLLQAFKSGATLLLAPLGGPSFKEREFLGRKIHSLPVPTMPTGGDDKTVEQTLHFTASGGYLAVSTDAAMIEDYLRSGETKPKPLAETAGLAEASQKVGGMATGLFGYQNDAENVRVMMDFLRNNPNLIAQALALSPIAPQTGDADKALKEWLDFSLLPPFEKIAKYFHLTVLAGQVTKEGYKLNTFSPRPPQMK